MTYIFLFLLIGIPILMVVLGIGSVVNDIAGYLQRSARYEIRSRAPLARKYQVILEKYCAYYKVLSADDKKEFEQRLKHFMYGKQFIARSLSEVTDEMRVLISATAIQLTFGLAPIYLAHFDKILIYADKYYSQINRRYHKGEVNPRLGIIVVSWKAFVEGFSDLEDSYNLGIHEMAHAIHFENRIRNEEYDFLNRSALELFELIATREIKNIRSGARHFLRPYAGDNEYEFFAVTLEYFFEQPKLMKMEIPDLYEALKRLLNQDPISLYRLA